MRLSEVQQIHTRLGRICAAKREGGAIRRAWRSVEWDRFFGGIAILFLGAAVGGGFGLIPLLSVEDTVGQRTISDRAIAEYGVALGICIFIGLLALIARMAIKGEREDSVMGIYTDLGTMVDRYTTPTSGIEGQ